jgi:chorismate mutase/prephenate dehydrogenase
MSLDALRDKLAEVDRELLALVARRRELSTEVGRIKRERGLPPRDFRQEREVVERARRAAGQHGLPPRLGEELVLLLIRHALTVQEQDQVQAHASGSGKRALVIGGAGRMGRWFVNFLDSQGYRVEVADPADETAQHADWRDATLDHHVIVVAAPLGESNRILSELAERRPTGLVFDIGSLKTPLRPGLQKLAAAGVRVASLHPMFGPDTELLSGSHVVFVDVGVAGAVEEAKALFSSTMAVAVEMDLDEHDRLIAYVLGLSHALNIAFFTALSRSGEAAPRLHEISSTTFDHQLRIAGNVARESSQLYFEIQALNPYGSESLEALRQAVADLSAVVARSDDPAFTALMRDGRRYLSDLRRP